MEHKTRVGGVSPAHSNYSAATHLQDGQYFTNLSAEPWFICFPYDSGHLEWSIGLPSNIRLCVSKSGSRPSCNDLVPSESPWLCSPTIIIITLDWPGFVKLPHLSKSPLRVRTEMFPCIHQGHGCNSFLSEPVDWESGTAARIRGWP